MVYTKTLKLKTLIKDLPDCEGYLIAYSGGADSSALLQLFAQAHKVRAIHINHGLQKQADDWQKHCQKTCAHLGIDLIIEQANLTSASESSCRKARYAIFKKHLKTHEILLTAHHKQDQAETVLLKLLRGTGLNGLTGIQKLRKFYNGFIARPLLDYYPQQLKDYLRAHNISWIEDGSNKDNAYKRNLLRNEVLPILQSQFANATNNIVRSAKNTQQSLALLNHYCEFHSSQLPLSKLQQLPTNLQPSLVYHWLSLKNLPTPDTKALTQITCDFIHAAADKNPHYQNAYYQLFRSQGAIYCIENFDIIDPDAIFHWNTDKPFVFPNGCGSLTFTGSEPLDLKVRFNQKGQKIKLPNRNTKTIKNLFQEHAIPPWEKLNTPFIYRGNELISLGYKWSNTKSISSEIRLNYNKLNL